MARHLTQDEIDTLQSFIIRFRHAENLERPNGPFVREADVHEQFQAEYPDFREVGFPTFRYHYAKLKKRADELGIDVGDLPTGDETNTEALLGTPSARFLRAQATMQVLRNEKGKLQEQLALVDSRMEDVKGAMREALQEMQKDLELAS